jgi:hypothetical protein
MPLSLDLVAQRGRRSGRGQTSLDPVFGPNVIQPDIRAPDTFLAVDLMSYDPMLTDAGPHHHLSSRSDGGTLPNMIVVALAVRTSLERRRKCVFFGFS